MINNVFSIAGFFFLSAVAPYLLDEDKIQIHETQCNAVMLASENDGLIQYLALFSTFATTSLKFDLLYSNMYFKESRLFEDPGEFCFAPMKVS